MKKSIIILLIITFGLLAGCSSNNESEKDAELITPSVFPLTGLEADESANNRIISVMVNNHSAARPQSGLSQADIVFEILAEGNITRFLALYQSEQPDVVGPVRSAREYYFDLASGYDALYVYHGAANFVTELIKDSGIQYLNGALHDDDGNLFKRESFRKAPHNSYLQFNAAYDVAEEKGYKVTFEYEPLPFLGEDEVTGDSANDVEISYSSNSAENVRFEYDSAAEIYERFNGSEQTVELNSDEPIQVENVFIIEANHEVIDTEGRRAIDLTAGGTAYLIQKGIFQELKWENQNGRIIPVKDGQTVGFAKGKTWINVVPSSPGIKQSVNISTE